MEGRRGEYRGNKGKAVAMFAEMIEDAYNSCVTTPPPEPEPLYPLVDSEEDPNVPTVSSFLAPNPTIRRDYFAERDPDKFPMAFVSNSIEDFKSAAFLSLGGRFNSALDSGCTDHIIRHRKVFQHYDTSKAVSIGTANSGSLEALAGGDVSFRVPYHDRHGQVQQILFTLRNCLHAPDAPVNLISVGALNEQGLAVTFNPGASTELSLPLDDPDLPGFTFHATVIRRLSLLHCDFVLPGDDLLKPSAFPAISFPNILPSPSLWHRRFGHLGKDATRAALTQDYVRGAVFKGSFVHENCIACIIGKSPQHSYAHNGRRASQIGELLHMDLCGPYPTQGPHGENHFYVILDDCSNVGFTFCLRKKSDAFAHYERTEAFLERSTGCKIKAVRVDGALELTAGKMGTHLASRGIAIQKTAPYAHPQAGKIERYVRTIEEGGQTLLADSGLSMTFWCDAVLTSQYLRNRLPTSTLAANITPFEVITRTKPDVSHLRVWGCQCFVAIPDELRDKAGFKRFEGIFVGYEEHRLGWRVRDLKGKYHFSRDVIFNEDLSGRLGLPRSLPLPTLSSSDSSGSLPIPRPTRDRVRTAAGRAYDDILKLKDLRRVERDARRKLATAGGNVVVTTANGDADIVDGLMMAVDGGVGVDGGANLAFAASADLSPSAEAVHGILSLQTPSSFPDAVDVETDSLVLMEPEIIQAFCLAAVTPSRPRVFNLTKEPSSYSEAIARPDAPAWRAAMGREEQSLQEMGAFEEVDLPPGQNTVGLIWVFANKTDADGVVIPGKEKARLVAQGFSQRPGQFDETYAPVAKMASVRVLLTWATVQDLEVYQFDCKTAFLHAKLRHSVYARPYPGCTRLGHGKVLRILVALYGLRQSAYEFYMLFLELLLELGMIRCEVDHGVFFGRWVSPPDSSVSMPLDGSPLVLYVPLHVDDGLAVTNSTPLYLWFVQTLKRRLLIVDMGPCKKFLNLLLIRDRARHRAWLSSHVYVAELLEEWNLTTCKTAITPFPSKHLDLPPAPLNAVPDVSDAELIPKYQRLVGCLLYLAITTRPDISYYAMWLGQYNAKPNRSHFLLAKHILRYLAGTKTLALSFGAPSSSLPSSLAGYMQNVGCSDADWASDSMDRKSISGYSFFFEGSLVSWSAVKQKSIALSSTEAEYYAMTHAFKEALWLRVFLSFMNFPVPRPFPILSDNQAACSLSNSISISARSKHIDIRHHFIRAHINDGSFSTIWIPTTDMPADIFTKSLSSILFIRHRTVLGLSVPFSSV